MECAFCFWSISLEEGTVEGISIRINIKGLSFKRFYIKIIPLPNFSIPVGRRGKRIF
jgi:hypothetical protein